MGKESLQNPAKVLYAHKVRAVSKLHRCHANLGIGRTRHGYSLGGNGQAPSDKERKSQGRSREVPTDSGSSSKFRRLPCSRMSLTSSLRMCFKYALPIFPRSANKVEKSDVREKLRHYQYDWGGGKGERGEVCGKVASIRV